MRGGESGVKSRGDSAKSGAGTVVGRGRTDSTTAESSPGGTRRVAVRSTEDGAARSEGGEGGGDDDIILGDGDVVLGDGDVVLARIHAGRASPVDFETPSVDFDPRGESAETPRAVASAGAFVAGLQVSRAAEIDAAGPAPDDGDGDVVLARPAAAPASSRASLDSSTRERRFGR